MALTNNNYEKILLQPQGCLDSRGGGWLQQQLESLAPRRYKFWIVDLSCVEFIDSSGLVALGTGLNLAAQAGAQLILCGLRPSVQLIFDITQLDRAFTIVENYDAVADHDALPVALIESEDNSPALEIA